MRSSERRSQSSARRSGVALGVELEGDQGRSRSSIPSQRPPAALQRELEPRASPARGRQLGRSPRARSGRRSSWATTPSVRWMKRSATVPCGHPGARRAQQPAAVAADGERRTGAGVMLTAQRPVREPQLVGLARVGGMGARFAPVAGCSSARSPERSQPFSVFFTGDSETVRPSCGHERGPARRSALPLDRSELSKLGVQRSLELPECATPPEEVYELAKRRGMDFVTITDHDTIAGRSSSPTCPTRSSPRS